MTEFKRVFLDTSPVIYYLQRDLLYFEQTKNVFFNLGMVGAEFVLSDITIAEYCVFPIRTKNDKLVEELKGFIRESDIEIFHTSENIAIKAAHIRAKYKGFKMMDSLQIATAIESGCDLFLTNDKQLRQFSELHCLTIDDFGTLNSE